MLNKTPKHRKNVTADVLDWQHHWVSSDGTFYPVASEGHYGAVKDLIAAGVVPPMPEYEDGRYAHMTNHGFIRITGGRIQRNLVETITSEHKAALKIWVEWQNRRYPRDLVVLPDWALDSFETTGYTPTETLRNRLVPANAV